MLTRLLAISLFILLASCTSKVDKPITIAINPWPGYELLYLAEYKKFFKKTGANIKLLQLGSLSDAQRAYLHGHADGMASTLIESVQAQIIGNKPLKIVMVPDYSNGGDIIVSTKDIKTVSDLKGRTVGCEVSSLGIFILQRALSKSGLTLKDVKIVNVEQADGENAILNKSIDAYVSYPPVSVNILKHDNTHKIFSSADIPKEVVDVVSISQEVLDKHPNLINQLHEAWGMALDYFAKNPDDAITIMAKREDVSFDDFKAIISEDLMIMNSSQQKQLLQPDSSLHEQVAAVCNTLVHVGSIDTDCKKMPNIIYNSLSN